MTDYRKEVKLTSTGLIFASVYLYKDGEDIECVGHKSFLSPLFRDNREQRLKKAHKWADNTIELAKEYEVRK